MSGVNLEVTVEGEKQVSRRLLIVADGVSDFESPLKKIGGELHKTFQSNFDSGGSLFGGWVPRKQDYPWPILDKTSRMRNSFKQKAGKNELEITNSTSYFKYHQSNKSRKRLPRRVMMKIDNERRNFITKTFQAYIVQLIRGKR